MGTACMIATVETILIVTGIILFSLELAAVTQAIPDRLLTRHVFQSIIALTAMAAVHRTARTLAQAPVFVPATFRDIICHQILDLPASRLTIVPIATADALNNAYTQARVPIIAAVIRVTHHQTLARYARRSTSAVPITAAASRTVHTLGQEPDRAHAIQATL